MANISLNKATRTCKVNTGWAERIFSDRFENCDLLMCPTWNNTDLAGRQVCADSFYTKREGCNSSLDRINVENDLRPQYAEYITLDSCGISGDMYGGPDSYVGVTDQSSTESYSKGSNPAFWKSAIRESWAPTVPDYKPYNSPYSDALQGCGSLNQIPKITGQFGQGNFRADIEPTCNNYAYEEAMADMAQSNREASMINHGARYQGLRNVGGW